MARKTHTVEQIIGKLREAEVALSKARRSIRSIGPWASRSRPTTAGARNTAGSRPGQTAEGPRTREYPAQAGRRRPDARQINSHEQARSLLRLLNRL